MIAVSFIWSRLSLNFSLESEVVTVFLCVGCVFRYAITKAFCVAFVMTFFSVFDVPVFWPILLCYWIVLFVLTMRRQIIHMIKYKYVPFSIGKQVDFSLQLVFVSFLVPCIYVLAYVYKWWQVIVLILSVHKSSPWPFDRGMVGRNRLRVPVV